VVTPTRNELLLAGLQKVDLKLKPLAKPAGRDAKDGSLTLSPTLGEPWGAGGSESAC